MENTNDFIIVTDNGMKHLLPLEEILHVEAVRMYSIFYLRNNAHQYVSSHNLGKVYSKLQSKNFLRIHKSHIININEIKSYQQGRGGKVVLTDNTIITVGQRRKTELLRHLAQLNRKENQKPDPRITTKGIWELRSKLADNQPPAL